VLTINPHFSEAHYNLGIVLQALGRIDEAGEHFSKAIVIKPDYVEAHSNLGNIFKILGRTDEAVVSYKKAFSIKPDFPEAQYYLSYASEALKIGETFNHFYLQPFIRKYRNYTDWERLVRRALEVSYHRSTKILTQTIHGVVKGLHLNGLRLIKSRVEWGSWSFEVSTRK
jgi:tetratricopeptide (TPR) repeat protein